MGSGPPSRTHFANACHSPRCPLSCRQRGGQVDFFAEARHLQLAEILEHRRRRLRQKLPRAPSRMLGRRWRGSESFPREPFSKRSEISTLSSLYGPLFASARACTSIGKAPARNDSKSTKWQTSPTNAPAPMLRIIDPMIGRQTRRRSPDNAKPAVLDCREMPSSAQPSEQNRRLKPTIRRGYCSCDDEPRARTMFGQFVFIQAERLLAEHILPRCQAPPAPGWHADDDAWQSRPC